MKVQTLRGHRDRVRRSHKPLQDNPGRPELYFGLAAAVGTDVSAVQREVEGQLRRAGYSPYVVRVSQQIAECGKFPALARNLRANKVNEHKRINDLMNAGNKLRSDSKRGDIAALLALRRIRQIRRTLNATTYDAPVSETAYILNSLKHPKEVETLRDTYGDAFFLVAAYSPREDRRERLLRLIGKSARQFKVGLIERMADELIDRDQFEQDNDLGQNVRETFPQADVFIDASNPQNMASQIARFIDIVFGCPFSTPTLDEFGMYHAKANAYRSVDLSRQVGAAILSNSAEILSTGCNEVPRPGGGTFWGASFELTEVEPSKDYRDFRKGYDSSEQMKNEIVEELLERLRDWFKPSIQQKPTKRLLEDALHGSGAPLRGTRVSSIIEFGRIVHAEMAAICQAAQNGTALKHASLYCTTFPCHMCTRHIIASGVSRVVYIEPYPKSLAKELYSDFVVVDKDRRDVDDSAVSFDPFVGIAPRRYQYCFEKRGARKDNRGYAVEWNPRIGKVGVERADTVGRTDIERGFVEFLEQYGPKWGLQFES